MTRQGPRSALKANEFVENASIKFSLRVLNDHIISEDILNQLFEVGSVWRNRFSRTRDTTRVDMI